MTDSYDLNPHISNISLFHAYARKNNMWILDD
eukprot:COSAG05_NODE_24257_length_252_cov_2.013072_1_plen_31_part_01